MTTSTNRTYLPEVDQLRAFAALLVLFFHGFEVIGTQLTFNRLPDLMTPPVQTANPLLAIIEEGHSGVTLFIVLSGFILARGAIGNGVQYSSFLAARAYRIYPMMLICLFAAISAHRVSLAGVAEILLPINPLHSVPAGALTSMFWAVTIEIQCYLLFPFLIRFSNARGTGFLLQVVAVVCLMRLLVVLIEEANAYVVGYWTIMGRLDQFCIGIMAARLYPPEGLGRRGPIWLLLSLGLAGFSLYFHNHLHPTRTNGLSLIWPTFEGAMWAAVIVTYVAAARSVVPWIAANALTRFGEVSYSFYLLHFAVISAVIHKGAFVRPTGDGYWDALITTLIVVLPVTGAFAVLTYNTIEAPFLRLRPKYIVRPAAGGRSDVVAL